MVLLIHLKYHHKTKLAWLLDPVLSGTQYQIKINHMNVIYVVKRLARIITYRITLENTLMINLINVIYVAKDLL